jgi:hypothetical protein
MRADCRVCASAGRQVATPAPGVGADAVVLPTLASVTHERRESEAPVAAAPLPDDSPPHSSDDEEGGGASRPKPSKKVVAKMCQARAGGASARPRATA